jgi:hypothetical protein
MSETTPTSTAPVATAPVPATPTTTPTGTDGKTDDNTLKSNNNATSGGENEMTERNVPVNDPPVAGASSMQMPPLVVKQRGVSKPGVQPTAGSVSFDYTGPPVKVTNGTVMDLVTQFGIQNAWLAVLKLRGFNVNKESAEAILPIKRFRDRVRKLKQTAETLKTRAEDSATFFAKEFVSALNTGAMDSSASPKTNAQSGGSNQKESSSTDAAIESILRQAASEVIAAAKEPAKPKRKKNNTQKQPANNAPGASGSSHPNSTIDDVVSSVMNKIRNNEPFEGEDRNNGEINFSNVELPFNSTIHQQPHQQQQQMLFAPHLQPGQTIYMVQDESMIPMIQQQQQQQQQPHIVAPPPPAVSPLKGKAKGKKGKAAAAAAAAASQPSGSQIPQQQVVQMPSYLPQQQIAQQIRSPTSQSMQPQQVTVLTVPRNQNAGGNTSYSIPAGYSTAKFDNNTTVIFSNINDLIRAQQGPAVGNQPNQIAKVVTYQPGMTLPPGATIMSNPQGMSPGYQQIVTHPQAQQSMIQPQYVVAQTPAPQPAASPPKPQPQQHAAQAAVEEKAGELSSKKSPRRKTTKSTKRDDVALQNFNDSDFEELATPKRKDALKKAAAPKKEKKEPAEKKSKPTAAPSAPAPKPPAKKGRKRKGEPESEAEEEEANHSEGDSDVDENKSQWEKEVAQLKRQLQAERSRHYTQKRRATKLDDDYKRVLDRLQQTELNLALQMSECERLQAEIKKVKEENITTKPEENAETSRTNAPKPTRPASKRTSAVNKRRAASPSPSPAPGTSQKKIPKAKASPSKATPATTTPASTSTGATTTNNRKRGRPAGNAAVQSSETSESNKQPSPSPTPQTSEEDKPAFNPNDFIPRRAAAAKRIRYF